MSQRATNDRTHRPGITRAAGLHARADDHGHYIADRGPFLTGVPCDVNCPNEETTHRPPPATANGNAGTAATAHHRVHQGINAGAAYVFDIVQTATTDSLGNYSFTGLDAESWESCHCVANASVTTSNNRARLTRSPTRRRSRTQREPAGKLRPGARTAQADCPVYVPRPHHGRARLRILRYARCVIYNG